MATILGLAMKVTADTSGFTQSLDPVDRALQGISKQTSSVIASFDEFAGASQAAANVQQETAYQLTLLTNALKDGQIGAAEFAAEFEKIKAAAAENVAVMNEAATIMAKYASESATTADRQQQLLELYEKGLIDLRAYNGEMLELLGINEQAAESEKARAAAAKAAAEEQKRAKESLSAAEKEQAALQEDAAKIMERNLEPIKRYEQEARKLYEMRAQGLIGEREFNIEIEKSRDKYTKAAEAAAGLGSAAKKAGNDGKLAFTELTGLVGLLPGPLGGLAARFTALGTSASGLDKIFSGGIRQAATGLVDSFGGLLTSANLTAAGLAAFGAAATAVWNGLSQLSGEVENLTNLSVRMGTSFESVQVLDEAAKRAGSSIQVVAASMQKFSANVNEARDSSSKAGQAFERLGISQAQLRNTDPTDLAKLTADALLKIEDPALRAALATETLGKKGLSLIPTFQAIGEASEAMERFGGAINDIDKQRLLDVDTELDNIKSATQGLGRELLLPFAGLVEGVASLFADTVGGLTQIIEPLGNAITPIFDILGDGIGEFGETLYNVGTIIGQVLAIGLTPFTNTMKALGPAISPVGVVLKGVNFLLEGLISLIDQTIAGWNNFVGAIPLVGQYLTVAVDDSKKKVGELRTDLEDAASIDGGESEAISKEFQKTLDRVQGSLSKAIDESAKFGQAGFDAALQYQESIKRLQEQFDAGILNETAFARAASEADAAYKQQIDTIKEATAETDRKAKAEEAAALKAREAIDKAIEESERALIRDQQFGGDEKRMKAAEQVANIQQEIARVEQELAAARAAGDDKAVEAATRRLAQLDQLKSREQDIASGAAAERDKKRKDEEKAAQEQKRRDEERAKRLEDANKAIADKQAEILEKEFDQIGERFRELSSAQGGAVKIGDIRSSEGASTFLALASGKADPAIEEYRKQLKELQAMRKDLQKLEAQKAEIMAGEKI